MVWYQHPKRPQDVDRFLSPNGLEVLAGRSARCTAGLSHPPSFIYGRRGSTIDGWPQIILGHTLLLKHLVKLIQFLAVRLSQLVEKSQVFKQR